MIYIYLLLNLIYPMLLQELQLYLKQHQRVSLQEIEQHFHIDANALRGMLQQLIRKGRIHQLASKACGQCHSCAPETLELYEWIAK